MMRRLWSVTVLLVFTLNSVSCQDSVEGFVGEDVVLSCICNSSIPKARVYWRDGSDRVLLDIVESSEDYTYQAEKYKGRVFSFPDQYKKGNFSIIMRNLQKDDSDTYECFISMVKYHKTISLSISDKPPVKAAEAHPPRDGAEGLNLLQVALLSALCLLLCF